ncbi:winged helix DNA-binding domain-containing protein [Nonomuraea typhae]|uniref:winged helix DNA-binding domain-containing protein n=1 Tax=Nonomuraea typhae TaxID=2603600 RepID=UPI0012F95ED0|nr:winged helix DNA-binding domain-containing protein [Nonomuraea typhae]
MPKVTREQILVYRLHGHRLTDRAPAADLTGVAGRCYPQNTPPGAAGLALAARVHEVTEERITAELDGKRLLQAFGARGAPHVFPARDAAVFTRGLLPETEEELRAFLRGAVPSLDRIGLAATDLAGLAAEAVKEILDGTALVKDDLGRRAGELITDRLPAGQRDGWQGHSPYSAQQFLGESLVRFALPVVSLRGILCHGGRQGRSPLLRRTDQWAGAIKGGLEKAPGELVERFLRCYGPATPAHLAEWGGIGRAQAERLWEAAEPGLAEVESGGGPRWVLKGELGRLESPEEVKGVRLLPPHDPYLQARDRQVLLPDRDRRKALWRTIGGPGAVLVDGDIRAVWRPKTRRRTLDVAVEPLGRLGAKHRAPIGEEAARVAAFRGLELGELSGC